MPFESKAQQRFMFAKHPRIAKRWAHETPDIKKLPEKVKSAAKEKDLIPGGLADSKSYKDFPPEKVRKGAKVEMEHTNSKAVAKEIASDHLSEDMNYYEKLKRMEKKSSLVQFEAFWDELEKISNALTRRTVAGARGAAIAKAAVPKQHSFDFGASTKSVAPPHKPSLVQQQMHNQGISRENFHARAQRAAQSALSKNQPEQLSMPLDVKKPAPAAAPPPAASTAPATQTAPVTGKPKKQRTKKEPSTLSKGLQLRHIAGAGALAAGAYALSKSQPDAPQQPQY